MGKIAGHKLVPERVSCEIVTSSDRLRQLNLTGIACGKQVSAIYFRAIIG
jgi:hypothetical protein